MWKVEVGMHEDFGDVMYQYNQVMAYKCNGETFQITYINKKGELIEVEHEMERMIEFHMLSKDA